MKSQLATLKPYKEHEVTDASVYLNKTSAVWAAATMAERREIVLSLLTLVVCDPDRKCLVFFTPKPVFAPFFRHYDTPRQQADGSFEFVI